MTVRPDFGPDYGEEERRDEGVALPVEREGLDSGDWHQADLVRDDSEAHAPGQVCARCGSVITPAQDARMRADGHWIHEECPADLGVPQSAETGKPTADH